MSDGHIYSKTTLEEDINERDDVRNDKARMQSAITIIEEVIKAKQRGEL